MIARIKKPLKRLFFYWIEKDLNNYMDLLENYKLKRHLQNSLAKEVKNNQLLPNAVDYAAAFVVSMYSNNQEIPATSNNLKEEATFLVKEFSQAYRSAIAKKEWDLLKYLAIPEIQPTEEEKELFKAKKNELASQVQRYAELKDKNYKQALDNVFQIAARHYNRKYKKFGRPGLKHYAVAIWSIIYQCVQDITAFSTKYKVNYVEDGEQRCLFNYFNLYIHAIAFTGKILLPLATREIMFAAAALHPAQDDYLDHNQVDTAALEAIHRKVQGQPVECESSQLQVIFDLIDLIYSRFSPTEHPRLVEIFTALHEWQCKSMAQKTKQLSEEELLEISFMKGGYAFAFYGYIALGQMDPLQFRHFFSMGAIFQIMDDLHDIETDLANDVQTIWTSRIKMNREPDEALYGIIGVQRRFEGVTNTISSLKRPVFIRRMELFAIRLDLVKFYLANRKYFSDELLDNVQQRFNIDLRPYVEGYKLKLDQLQTMQDFEKMLMDLKDSYTQAFLKK